MGKLIVIDGLDGSGKATQSKLLKEYLESLGKTVRLLSFPDYEHPTAHPIKLYLEGKMPDGKQRFSNHTSLEVIRIISQLYTINRYATFVEDWKKDYEDENTIIIADRYVTSNIIHQGAKINPIQRSDYCNWLEHLEYDVFKLPKPDRVLFISMPLEVSQELMSKRYNGDESKKDIHESDLEYLEKCRNVAEQMIETDQWIRVKSVNDFGELREIKYIQYEIQRLIEDLL